MRFLVVLVVLATVVALRSAPAPAPAPLTTGAASPVRARVDRDLVVAQAVLRGWDARRLAAWRAGDRAALRRLYLPGSRAGAADLRLLRAYDAHGLVVRQLWTQVFAVRVLGREPDRMRLRVLDRVAGGVAERAGIPVPLPSTRPTTREVDLRRVRGAWRVVETRG